MKNFFLFFYFSIFIIFFHFQSVNSYASGTYDCPMPWVGFEGFCYNFVPYPSTIQDAKSVCQRDSAYLLQINSQEENDFIVNWLLENVKEGNEWFTDGIKDARISMTSKETVRYIWETSGLDISGQHFWYSNQMRNRTGNRITYYTDGSTWGWALLNDTGISRSFVCMIEKTFIYKITTIDRGFDFGVNEIDPDQLDFGPILVKEPQDTIFDPRSSLNYIKMDCEAVGKPRPTYLWMVKRQLATLPVDLTDPAITVTNGILKITDPNDKEHNGDYHCIASNSFGSVRSRSAHMSFGYLNDFPKSKRDPVRVMAYSGQGIECIPPKTNYKNLVYSWFKDDPSNWIRPSVKWHTFVSNDGRLYFQYVSKEDKGDYTCFVTTRESSTEGKSSMPITLEVIEASGSEQEPIIVNGFPKAFPSSPLVGQDVRVECIAYGTSYIPLNYRWERVDGKPMPKNVKFTDYKRVLIIPNIQETTAGTYRCIVDRQLGKGTYRDIQLVIEASPFFTIPLSNQHVDLGNPVDWVCMAYGDPAVSYSWFVNSSYLSYDHMTPDQRKRIKISGNKLTISSSLFQDAGMYQCAVENAYGTEFNSAQLRVLSFPPTFQKFPLQTNTYGMKKTDFALVCNPESSPPSTKTWLKDGSPLAAGTDPSSRVQILPNGNLLVKQSEESDKGYYTCNAENKLGKASSTGHVDIKDPISIIQSPRATVVMVNQTAFFQCQASHSPTLDVTYDWYHNSYKIMFIKVRNLGNKVHIFTEPHYERGTGIYRGSLYINNVQFFHAGDYHCVAKTTSNHVRAKELLVVEGPPGEPGGVLGSDSNATAISLTWWPGPRNGKDINSFIVEAMNPAEGFWRQVKIEYGQNYSDNVLIKSRVSGLNPFTEYKFRVFGVNIYGKGTPSKISPLYKTAQAPPVIYPMGLKGGGGKVGTLNITWDPVPISKWNADVGNVGYIVYWKKFDMNENEYNNKTISDPHVTKLTVLVGPKNFYTEYHLKIRFYNPKGVGPWSPRASAMSAEDLPTGVPITVRAVYYNATAIMVEWRPVPNTRDVMRGVLLGYRINYWVDKEEDEQMGLFRIVRNQTDHGLIIALREDTDYMINVQAVNTAGNGPKSENYRTKTLRAAPKEAPQQVRVSYVDENSVELHWRGVYTTIEEEPLEGYIVRYWRRGENIYVATNEDAGKQVRYILRGLEPYVQYECRVYGYSRGGDGLQSSPTLEFIIGDNSQIIRDSPDKTYIVAKSGYSHFMYGISPSIHPSFFYYFIHLFIFLFYYLYN